jgi:uncharacterized membrane protein HdeD (DUF308 family)
MPNITLDQAEVIKEAARVWWLYLVTGILWILAALIILRFDYTSIAAISILFGVVAIVFGINEFFGLGTMTTGWKIVHIGLGIIFVVVGIVALAHPYDTFATLAALIGFVLVVKGVFDIIVAFVTKDDIAVWWLQLIVGIVEVLLGFWASGNFGRSAFLLVVFVAAMCLARGITEIIVAFKLHKLKREVDELDRTSGPPPAPAV